MEILDALGCIYRMIIAHFPNQKNQFEMWFVVILRRRKECLTTEWSNVCKK